ncbi:hypothetical protein QMK11_02800 [Campylobacter jejuni]|nr:hypothetical protein QMK15_02555 [Campylobacter jejuni]WHN19216.1 hypothetical protein QMK11_02800 [Campylobacter jejuni]
MKICRSDVFKLVDIISFSELRLTFVNFAKENNIKIEKINYNNHISFEELLKSLEIYKNKRKKINVFNEKPLIERAFLNIENFIAKINNQG